MSVFGTVFEFLKKSTILCMCLSNFHYLFVFKNTTVSGN